MQIADDAVQTWDVVQTLLKDGVKYSEELNGKCSSLRYSQRSSARLVGSSAHHSVSFS